MSLPEEKMVFFPLSCNNPLITCCVPFAVEACICCAALCHSRYLHMETWHLLCARCYPWGKYQARASVKGYMLNRDRKNGYSALCFNKKDLFKLSSVVVTWRYDPKSSACGFLD